MKYMGSKARLSKKFATLFNRIIQEKDIKTYVEPFVGGANMIDKVECENRVGIDYNEYLISMWNALQKGWEIPREITKEEYDKIKNNMDSYPKELVATVGFCASYNAKWFGGYAGIVHTKIGTQGIIMTRLLEI